MVEELSPANDGREQGNWRTRYCAKAWCWIALEGVYLAAFLSFSLYVLYLIWNGHVYALVSGGCLNGCSETTFSRFASLTDAGVIGGLLFGIKYLYRVVARGYWNADRVLWRLLEPCLAGVLALGVGALVDSGILVFTVHNVSNISYFAIGFITGFFADNVAGKLKGVADHLFG